VTTRRHVLPFGAEIQPDGAVRFRLWAPGARQVEICVEGQEKELILPMDRQEDGWHVLQAREASAGTLYRYRIDGDRRVPDPASRFQPQDVHGPSQVVDPTAFSWQDADWQGRPWEETLVYELHVGTFSGEGTFWAVTRQLDYLVDLGVSAIELMPVADFPGDYNWGYDGVSLYAPDASYGRPEDLKTLIQSAHTKGLMVFLDVVYNHFGPEGNYLHVYASEFFTERHETPWGAGINFDGMNARPVRDFFIHNALYWLEEYHLDGLRFDAVHAIVDDSQPDILEELASAVHAGPGAERYVHLVLENDHNTVHPLRRRPNGSPSRYTAQWNDDIHHALHVLITGETDGFYADYADRPAWYVGRCLAQGFGYQGERSPYRDGVARGESSAHLPPTAFVSFLQNHDQAGNRALGERIGQLVEPDVLQAALAVVLLAPAPPLLFMGQEFAAQSPFLFFCDFGDADLARAVREGRRREFARFERFADAAGQETLPDPNAQATFEQSKLDWESLLEDQHRAWLALHQDLIALRQREIIPRLNGIRGGEAEFELIGATGLIVHWRLGDGSHLTLLANLGNAPLPDLEIQLPGGTPLYATPAGVAAGLAAHRLPPWAVAWFLRPAGAIESPRESPSSRKASRRVAGCRRSSRRT
jgi:maltooligosyltrehalose trehalohydrolase